MARKFDLPRNIKIKDRTLWVRVKQVDGERPWVASRLPAFLDDAKTQLDEQSVRKAQAFMQACEEEVWREQKALDKGETASPNTVRRHFKSDWLPRRFKKGFTSATDDAKRFENYVLPVIGDLLMDDVRPHHVDEVMERVTTYVLPGGRRTKPLSPSAVRTCYWLLHGFFKSWCGRRYLPNPCDGYDDLPKRRDQDPLWRLSAYYSATEIERLISDERIPLDRRVAYAILFFTGCRWGEFAALRWSRWIRDAKPLGKLHIAFSYSTKLVDAEGNKLKGEKLTKTDVPRQVPVHPELAKILAEWKLAWANFYGRPARDEDLVVPARAPGQRTLDTPDYQAILDAEPGLTKAQLAARLGVSRAAVTQGCRRAPVKRVDLEKAYRGEGWHRLQEDLALLGIRRRRTHDVRRTTYSLLVENGAGDKITTFMLWGPSSTAVRDVYASITWAAFCAEMVKLPVRRQTLSKVLELPAAVGVVGTDFGTALGSAEIYGGILAPTTGLEPDGGVTRCSSVLTNPASSADLRVAGITPIHSERHLAPNFGPTVGTAHPDPVLALEATLASGSAAERKALRKQLARLLADLDD
jgi:integrase